VRLVKANSDKDRGHSQHDVLPIFHSTYLSDNSYLQFRDTLDIDITSLCSYKGHHADPNWLRLWDAHKRLDAEYLQSALAKDGKLRRDARNFPHVMMAITRSQPSIQAKEQSSAGTTAMFAPGPVNVEHGIVQQNPVFMGGQQPASFTQDAAPQPAYGNANQRSLSAHACSRVSGPPPKQACEPMERVHGAQPAPQPQNHAQNPTRVYDGQGNASQRTKRGRSTSPAREVAQRPRPERDFRVRSPGRRDAAAEDDRPDRRWHRNQRNERPRRWESDLRRQDHTIQETRRGNTVDTYRLGRDSNSRYSRE